MFYWKLAAGVIAGVSLLLFVGELQRLHGRSEAYADCQAQAAGRPPATKGSRCSGDIAAAVLAAAEARSCDLGLRPLSDAPNRWAAPLFCSRKIQTLAASNNAGWDTLGDRDLELDRLRSGQAAAIARAETRATLKARSEANAKAAIDRAPRDPAGDIVCGDICLRQLAGETAPGSRPAAGDRSPH